MASQSSKLAEVPRVRAIDKKAMRSAVMAPTERGGFDMLAEALCKVSELIGLPLKISYA